MTQDEFDALVARLDEQARCHPLSYKLRVVLLAFIGYGYLAAVLLVLLAAFVGALASVAYLKAFAIKIIIPLGAFIWVVVRALWVSIEPPEGMALTRREAPELFAMIAGLQAKLRSQRFHRVLVTDDFNAAVVQVPRLGIFGWHRNYLLLGLPLMKSLTRAQFEAVLAHELGHLAGGHGRLSNWIYRVRMSWAKLVAILEAQRSWGSFMFRSFFNWYAPYFSAYSFPLARANEYEADATSARLVSPQAAAEALTNINVIGSYLQERFWPEIHKKADEVPQPSFTPFTGMGHGFAGALDAGDAQTWLEQALAAQTTAANTHPCLTDRLRGIGQEARLAPPASDQAADTLLGESLPRIAETLDQKWQQRISRAWQDRYHEVQQGRAHLAELDALARVQEELPLPDACEHARLTEAFGEGPDAALEQFRQLHARAPDDANVLFALGQRLLARDDEAGYALVEQAIERNPDAAMAGAQILRDYCWRKGRQEEAHVWHTKVLEGSQVLQAAREERATLTTQDRLLPHDLDDAVLAELRRQIRAIPEIRKAYLVRKRVLHLPDVPCFVLGFMVTPWWSMQRKRRVTSVQKRVLESVRFPGEAIVFPIEGDNVRFGKRMRRVRGARVV